MIREDEVLEATQMRTLMWEDPMLTRARPSREEGREAIQEPNQVQA